MSENAREDGPQSQSDVLVEAWEQLLDEMHEIADDREDDGWEVLELVADHTSPLSKDDGADRWGLSHIVPDSDAEAFEEFYDRERFTEYLAYGQVIQTYMYLVTELIDPAAEDSVLIASRYDQHLGKGMINSAKSEDVLHTHVQKIDGTVVGSFEHETYGPLIGEPVEPNPDEE